MHLKISYLSLLLIFSCGQQPRTDSDKDIRDCGNKVSLKFSNGEVRCAENGEETINIISSHSSPLAEISVGSFWPTKETAEMDIDRVIEKLLSSSKIASVKSTNDFFSKKLPLYAMFKRISDEHTDTKLEATSKHYALKWRDNFLALKKIAVCQNMSNQILA